MSSYRRTGIPCKKIKNMKHWHATFWEFKKHLPSELVHTFIGFSKYISTDIGTIPQYSIYTFGIGETVTYITVGNSNVGYAIIENTDGIGKESVMAFVQERLEAIEDMLENY